VSDDMEKKGPGKPGGGKDLDELKAKLGLGRPTSPSSPVGTKPKEVPKRDSKEDFKFSFGDAGGKSEPSFSAKELADIDAEANKAANPIGRWIILGVVGLGLTLLVLWLGFQFGNSMGSRVLHNAAVTQSQEIKDFFLKKFANAAGDEIDPRRDITTRFVEQFEAYQEEHVTGLMALGKLLSEGTMPPEFKMEEFEKKELAELKTMCKEYLRNIEGYSVATILKGELYSTELGAKLLEFADRANKLRNRVENLYLAIEMLEAYLESGDMPGDIKGEVLVHGLKADDAKEALPVIAVVEIAKGAKAELDKELTTKEICEPVAMELEIPTCGGKGEPETEKRLIEVFDKKVVEEVRQFRKIKIKLDDGKPMTARIENLFKMDLRPFLKPLIERIKADKKMENENLAVLVNNLIQNMSDVRMAGEAVDFVDLLDALEKYASQEQFFTL
jgi:hypothetical protein